MSLKTSETPAERTSDFRKSLLFVAFLLSASFFYTASAEAQFMDKVKALFANLKSTSSKSINAAVENNNIQSIALLGQESSEKSAEKETFLGKVLNEDATAFTVEEGMNSNSLDQAISEESMHALDEISIYTVVKGDTLASIASYFEVTPDTISTFNNLADNEVEPDMVLEIPHISGILYTFKKGDTLSALSKKYKVTTDDISLYNGLVFGAEPTVGDDLFLPGAFLPKVDVKKDDKADSKDTKLATKTKDSKKKTIVDNVKDKLQKLTTGSDVNAITKIKKFSTRFADLPKYDGYYIFPAPGAHRSQGLHGANAADLAAPVGTDIIASAPGTITVARATGWNYGYGQYIVISHPNGTQTVYAHLSNISVSVGQSVARGQKIGDMGSTGNSTGSHVHFEIRGAFNPFAW